MIECKKKIKHARGVGARDDREVSQRNDAARAVVQSPLHGGHTPDTSLDGDGRGVHAGCLGRIPGQLRGGLTGGGASPAPRQGVALSACTRGNTRGCRFHEFSFAAPSRFKL